MKFFIVALTIIIFTVTQSFANNTHSYGFTASDNIVDNSIEGFIKLGNTDEFYFLYNPKKVRVIDAKEDYIFVEILGIAYPKGTDRIFSKQRYTIGFTRETYYIGAKNKRSSLTKIEHFNERGILIESYNFPINKSNYNSFSKGSIEDLVITDYYKNHNKK